MARLVVRTARQPHKVEPPENGKALYICACGLSANQPFCDGTHNKIPEEPEGEPVRYERVDGRLVQKSAP